MTMLITRSFGAARAFRVPNEPREETVATVGALPDAVRGTSVRQESTDERAA
jgi:hypothetical protein